MSLESSESARLPGGGRVGMSARHRGGRRAQRDRVQTRAGVLGCVPRVATPPSPEQRVSLLGLVWP